MKTTSTLVSPYRNLEFILGTILAGGVCLLVAMSWFLYPDGGESIDLVHRLQAPFQSFSHILGTDPLGRDVLARVVVGGRISLLVGIFSVAGAVTIGVFLGLIAGYYRGFWDLLVMRLADIQLALPFILLAITFTAIIGGGLRNTIILLVITQWVQYARLVRGLVMTLREREFILSARAIGVKDRSILFRHLLPNLAGPVIVLITLNIANNILLESSLTFLGMGVDVMVPSWGGMLADGRTYLQTAWWVSVFPGLTLLLLVLGLNLFGDWLRDRLDPTGRTSR